MLWWKLVRLLLNASAVAIEADTEAPSVFEQSLAMLHWPHAFHEQHGALLALPGGGPAPVDEEGRVAGGGMVPGAILSPVSPPASVSAVAACTA